MHGLVRIGLERAVVAYWSAKGEHTDYLRGTRKQRFSKIYERGRWTSDDTTAESLSGRGSTLEATARIRAELPRVLAEFGVLRLLDVGCGDFNWMKDVDLPCEYVGIDIVDSVIQENTRKYFGAGCSFLTLDAVEGPLPQADAVLCREVLFHLSFKDALALLQNVRACGARYLLVTSDPSVSFNADIPTGAWRDVNIGIRPYELGAPVHAISDGEGPNKNRILGVWDLRT